MIMIDFELLKYSIYSFITVIISLTIHEVSHGLASLALGDDTAKRMGRLTLNPLKHLDPIGAILLFFFHFGWAKPVPINPNYYKNYRLGTVITGIAGPFSNIIMAFISAVVYMLISYIGAERVFVYEFLQVFMILNIGLAVFNLIPISPLDGSKILFAFLPERIYRRLLRYERFGFPVLIVLMSLGAFNGITDGAINYIFLKLLNLAYGIFY